MTSNRRISIATGVLLIVATAADFGATAILSTITGPNAVSEIAIHPVRVAAAAFGYLLAAVASVGVAVALYPLLKRTHPALALGAVVFRTMEAVFDAVGVVCLLTIGTLFTGIHSGGATGRAASQAVADALVSISEHGGTVAVFAFCIGASMYYFVLYQTGLLPRWLSGFGLLAAVLMVIAGALSFVTDQPVTAYIPLAAPILLQEMVLAVWLLAKGFRPTGVGGGEAGVPSKAAAG